METWDYNFVQSCALSLHRCFTHLIVVYKGVLVDIVDPACRRRTRREDLASGQPVAAVDVTVGDQSGRVVVDGGVDVVHSGRPWARRQQLTVVAVLSLIGSRVQVVAVSWQPASRCSHTNTPHHTSQRTCLYISNSNQIKFIGFSSL